MPDSVPSDSLPSEAPQIQPGAHATANVSPDDYGAGIGRALQGIAGELQSYTMREQRYHDQESVQDALTQVGIKRLQLLKDPNGGLLNQDITDPAALTKASDKTLADFNSHVSEVSNGLTNDHQRAAFARGLREQRFGMESAVRDYEHQQGDKIATSKMVNGVKVMQANAVHFYDQPTIDGDGKPVDPVAQSIAQQREAIATTGQHLRWTPEQIQVAQAKATADTHVGVLQAMLAPGQDAQRASDYFDKVKGDLFPAEQDRFGRAVEAATLHQKTGAITHELMYDGNGHPRDEADVLDSMASDKRLQGDDRLATAVETNVSRTFRLQKAAKAQEQEQTFDGLWNNMSKVGGDLEEFPADVVQSLTPEHQRQLQAYGKQILEGKLTPDNSDAYYALRRQAATNPESFKGVDLRGYRSDLSAKNYAELIGVQAEIMGKPAPPSASKGLNVVSTKEQIMKPVLKGLNDKDAAAFARDVDSAVEASGGMEKVGTAGLQKIVDGLTINQHSERESKGMWEWLTTPFGQKVQEDKPRWRTLPEGYAFAAHQIPPEASAHVAELLRVRGITNPSEDQLLATYNAGLTHAGP